MACMVSRREGLIWSSETRRPGGECPSRKAFANTSAWFCDRSVENNTVELVRIAAHDSCFIRQFPFVCLCRSSTTVKRYVTCFSGGNIDISAFLWFVPERCSQNGRNVHVFRFSVAFPFFRVFLGAALFFESHRDAFKKRRKKHFYGFEA